MLTLGLTEGVLSATVMLLVLVGAANENAPLHKIFGPLVVVVVGFAAYLAHAAGAMHAVSDAIGLAFFAALAFFAPLGVMRTAWKQMRAMDGTTPRTRPARRRTTLRAVGSERPREESTREAA